MDYRNFNNTYFIRMDKGDEIISRILEVCRTEGISSCTYSGIGGCGSIEIRAYYEETDEFKTRKVERIMELVTLSGNVITDEKGELCHHTHAVLSYNEGDEHCIIAGHMESILVSHVAEIELHPVIGGRLIKRTDPVTGLGSWGFEAQTLLEKAKTLARSQFAGRTDKAGVDYFEGHLSSVASLVSSDEEKTVAYLHDVLEDTDYPEEKLREEFGDEITDAVVLLTHRDKLGEEGYLDYIRHLKEAGNELAIAVKIADLTNNSDYTRLGASSPEELGAKDRRRWEKYCRSLEILREGI